MIFRVLIATAALVTVPFAIALLLPFILWRITAKLLLWLLHRDRVTLATPLDTCFLTESRDAPADCVFGCILRGRWKDEHLDAIQEFYDQRISNNVKHIKHNATIGKFMGYWCWEWSQQRLNIRDHYTIPDGLDPHKKYTEKEVVDFTARILNNPYPKANCPWEILVFPHIAVADGDDNDPAFCVIHRCSHAFADAIRLNKFLKSVYDGTNNATKKSHQQTKAGAGAGAGAGGNNADGGRKFRIKLSWTSMLLFIEAAALALPVTFGAAILTFWKRSRTIQRSGKECCVSVSPAVSQLKLKQAAMRRAVRFSDLLFAVSMEAILRNCKLQEGKPSPTTSALLVFRMSKEESDMMENGFFAYPVYLPTDESLSLEQRIEQTSSAVETIRRSFHIPLALALGAVTLFTVLPSYFTRRMACITDSPIILSNIPLGITSSFSFGSYPVLGGWFIPSLRDRSGIFAVISSYKDNIKLHVTVDKSLLKEGCSVRNVTDVFARACRGIYSTDNVN